VHLSTSSQRGDGTAQLHLVTCEHARTCASVDRTNPPSLHPSPPSAPWPVQHPHPLTQASSMVAVGAPSNASSSSPPVHECLSMSKPVNTSSTARHPSGSAVCTAVQRSRSSLKTCVSLAVACAEAPLAIKSARSTVSGSADRISQPQSACLGYHLPVEFHNLAAL
jgi:hypothetical protein